ncbi:MAG: hypothetical protein J6W76_05750, partial [Spirochaetales bacterium]|nr:hypothetical protein [Spirochaetales bacterium]
MKKSILNITMAFIVVWTFCLIGCPSETEPTVIEKIVYRDNTGNPGNPGGVVNNTKITSLSVAISEAKDGDIIDFTLEKYRTITTIEQSITIDKAVTIKNFDNLNGTTLNVVSDGVSLQNVANAGVVTQSSMKISGSSLSSLNIAAVDSGRGDIKVRPPKIDILSSVVSSDVTVDIENAYLTVCDVSMDQIKFNADNAQLTIEDNTSVITGITTDKICQVVLEDGTSDTIPCSKEKIAVSGNGKLTQVNMQAAESMILTKLTPERGLVTTMKEDESIDFSSLEVVGTYMSSGAVTVFTAALTYDMQTTFSKLEKDFKIVIGNTLAYQRVNGVAVQTNFDWSSLEVGNNPAVIDSDFADKGSEYKYSFDIVVVERKIEHRLININLDVSNMKTDYLSGEALDLTGLVVEGTYLDNPSTPVGLLDTQYIAEPANGEEVTTDLLTHEIKTVHISDLSGDLSADIEIRVRPSCLFTIDYGYSQNGIPLKVVNRIEKGTVVYEPAASRYGYEFIKWVVDETVDYAGFNKEITDDNITVKALWSKNNPFVGAIVYRDGTTNDEENDRYIFMSDPIQRSVPIGIVFEPTNDITDSANGTYIGRMVHLNQAQLQNEYSSVPLQWCKSGTDTSLLGSIDTSDDDGSINWQNIMNVISDNIGNYPAFEYVNGLNSDQATIDAKYQWYLPAKNELVDL